MTEIYSFILIFFVYVFLYFIFNKYNEKRMNEFDKIIKNDEYYGYTKKDWNIVYKILRYGYLVILFVIGIFTILLVTIYSYKINNYIQGIIVFVLSLFVLYININVTKMFIELNRLGKTDFLRKYKKISKNSLIKQYFINIIKKINYHNQTEHNNIINFYFIFMGMAIIVSCIVFEMFFVVKLINYLIY